MCKNALSITSNTCFIAYQYGVPTKELAGQAMEAEPKSASFTCPGSVSKTFPAFISLSKTKQGMITAPDRKQKA